jgi:hypothetical protein
MADIFELAYNLVPCVYISVGMTTSCEHEIDRRDLVLVVMH